MRKTALLLALLTVLGEQTPVAEEFTVKPSIGPGGTGTRVSRNRVTADDVSLRMMIALAYETTEARVAAPDWTASDRYDVVAATENAGGPSALLRKKLSEAFGLDAKKESRTVPAAPGLIPSDNWAIPHRPTRSTTYLALSNSGSKRASRRKESPPPST